MDVAFGLYFQWTFSTMYCFIDEIQDEIGSLKMKRYVIRFNHGLVSLENDSCFAMIDMK